MKNNLSLSIVIPAYNEEKRIGKTLKKITEYLNSKKWDYEILVVDDGSKDKTPEIVNSFKDKRIILLKNQSNKGKGFTVRHGILKTKKDYILFSDADLSTPIEMIERFIPFLKDYDIVIGSRLAKGADVRINQPFYRRIPGKIFPLIVRTILLKGIKDTQCGFKLFKNDVGKRLFQKQKLNGFSFDAEVLYLAKKYGYSIKEIPVVWINALDSKLNPVKDSYKMFVELLKIKINDIKGYYK